MIDYCVEDKLDSIEELDSVTQTDSTNNADSVSVKSHEEIVELIQEIKELEERYGEFEIVEIQEEKEELIEVAHSETAESEQLVSEPEIQKDDLTKKLKKYKIFRIKVRQKDDSNQPTKEIKTATFKLRFDESGKLINTDFRKPTPNEPSKIKTKILGKLPKVSLKRRGKKGEGKTKDPSVESKEKKSIGSKLKGGLGGIGKLKKVIPSKGKNKKKKSKDK